MPKISSITTVSVPSLSDKLVGTSVGGSPSNQTNNFTLQQLKTLFDGGSPPASPNLQSVLNAGNTATQSIYLTGTIETTNLEVSNDSNLKNLYLSERFFDKDNFQGTSGQYLTSTGAGVQWSTLTIAIPTLQQVLTAGNVSDKNITTTGNIQGSTITGTNLIANSNLRVVGTLSDSSNSVGTNGQVLSSTVTGTDWVDLPSYSAVSPLIYNNTLKQFSIQQATGTQNGYLSSADWITFNGKQNAGNYITALTGEATASGPGSASITLNNLAVINKTLTGFTTLSGTVTSADSIITAFGKLQNQINGVTSGLNYQGAWNASTNVPTLISSVGTNGEYYVVDVAGNTNLNGITDWKVGDWAIFNGTSWQKIDNTDSVVSVNGQIGIVVLNSDNIAEGSTNLYFTDTRSRNAISSLATGLTYTAGTGVFSLTVGYSIPTIANQTDWTTAYNNSITSAAVTGTGTKTLTLNQQDGGTITASWTEPDVSGFVPYIGATQAVELGYNGLYSGKLLIDGPSAPQGGFLGFKQSTNVIAGEGSYTSIYAFGSNYLGFKFPQSPSGYRDFGFSVSTITPNVPGGRVYNMPDADGTLALTSDIPAAGLTSVGLSMPSAFSVANSPLTSNGTIAVTGAGLASQYVRGDGTLANFPTNGGGGSSVNYYLNGSINQGTFGGDAYYQMSKTPILGAGTNFTRTNGQGNGYIASFITDAGDPSLLNIPGGNWNLEFYFNSSATGGSPSFYADIYKVSSLNVFTLVASGAANPEAITNGTTVDQYFTSVPVPQTSLLTTDRLAIRIYVITSGRTITLHTENGNLCEVLTTLSTGLTALNGLTAQVQYFQVGTSGTDFNISSLVDNHTFNLPTASAANRGALSSADWSTFNSKQNTITLTTTGTSGAATLIGDTLNIPNYAPDLSGYVTLATDQTITGLKTILRGGDVLNFKIGTDTLYGLKLAYNQNELVPSGEATWSFVNTFNNGSGVGLETTPISFFRGVLVTGQRLLSASVNANLLDYYGNNPSGRYPVYAYNTGVQQFASSIIVGETAGVVNPVTGAIADLPAGVVANFNGRVIGSNAVNSDEFVTLGQLPAPSVSIMIAGSGTCSTIRDGVSNTAAGNCAFAGGGRNNTACGSSSFVGGGWNNTASGNNSVVVGGGNGFGANTASGTYSFVGGGAGNTSSGSRASVVGGCSNTALGQISVVTGGKFNTASGCTSTVSGGYCNVASGACSFAGGGAINTASGSYSFIGGGQSNTTGTGSNASVVGGTQNRTSSQNSFIGGGQGNCIYGNNYNAAIVAGQNNCLGTGFAFGQFIGGGAYNCVTGNYAAILGGRCHIASGACSAVIGGSANTASGCISTVSGGYCNVASGCYSFTGGGFANCNQGLTSSIVGGSSNQIAPYSCVTCSYSITCSNLYGACYVALSPTYGDVTSLFPSGQPITLFTASTSCATTVNFNFYNGASTVLLPNDTNPNYISVDTNVISGACSSFIGGGDFNAVCKNYSGVASGYCNRNCTNYSFIGGGQNNLSCSCGNYSVIGGGLCNTVFGSCGFIGGGLYNTVEGGSCCYDSSNSGIASGCCNKICGAYSSNSFIGGGTCNLICNSTSSISGGYRNCVFGYSDFIGSGQNNRTCSSSSVVVGGYNNCANCNYSFVGSGANNSASAYYAGILSGRNNTIASPYTCSFIIGSSITANRACTTFVNDLSICSFNFCSGCSVCIGSNGLLTASSGGGGGAVMVSGSGYCSIIGKGLGNTATSYFTFVGGGINNTASGNRAIITGGASNTASGYYTFIGGGTSNQACGNYSGIVAGVGNTISSAYTYSFIIGSGITANRACTTFVNDLTIVSAAACSGKGVCIGTNGLLVPYTLSGGSIMIVGGGTCSTLRCGSFNAAAGGCSTVSGGYNNSASGNFSTIGGGKASTVSAYYATIGGGNNNRACSGWSTVSGGYNNRACNTFATVGGGQSNVSSGDRSTVGGGLSNTASGACSKVGGGRNNTASGTYSTVSGGVGNQATTSNSFVGGGSSNTANGVNSTVSGGDSNLASGICSTVGGGTVNSANGNYSTVSGGYNNTASGYASGILGGCGNTVSHTKSFIIGSNLTSSANCTTYVNALSKTSGTFRINHPDPAKTATHYLQHSFVESPTRGDNIYRYKITTSNCHATLALPDYYKFLNEDDQVWVSPNGHFGSAYGVIDSCQNSVNFVSNADGEYNVLIIGTRKDIDAKNGFDGVEILKKL